jgi:hypothetical protein
MRLLRSLVAAPAVCAILGAVLSTPPAPAKAEQWIGRSVTLGGHKLNCNNAQIMVDRTLPSEGGAGDDFVILNPDMLKNQPETVRIFVFKHECGHLTVGDSELDADCFAVGKGVREHWLDKAGLKQVCDSFEGAPETDTHPSAARRCMNLDRCYTKAIAEQPPLAPKPVPATLPPKAPVTTTASVPESKAPELPMPKPSALGGPKAVSAWRCSDPLQPAPGVSDPIGNIIDQDSARAELCR